ncbi:MAG: hypothetical protein L0Y44_05665 [Phycisphaerales bacterium]|nr:hypothetical protein [Phycisphaerales bacterium]
MHTLSVRATDRSGNVRESTQLFEIRQRLDLSAVIVVDDFQCISGGQGTAGVIGTILLASHDFDVRDINLATVGLWLVDSNGAWMNTRPVTILGAFPTPGSFQYESAQADYENCYWTLEFAAEFAQNLSSCPVALELTGSGKHGQPGAFDFFASTPNVVDPNPIQTLDAGGLICIDPEPPPRLHLPRLLPVNGKRNGPFSQLIGCMPMMGAP